MYGALWRRIPGGLPGKIAGMVGLFIAAIALLFLVIFPFANDRLPWNDVNVDTPSSVAPSAPASLPAG